MHTRKHISARWHACAGTSRTLAEVGSAGKLLDVAAVRTREDPRLAGKQHAARKILVEERGQHGRTDGVAASPELSRHEPV
jgi:hypothetical protein